MNLISQGHTSPWNTCKLDIGEIAFCIHFEYASSLSAPDTPPNCQKAATHDCLHGNRLSTTSILCSIKIVLFPVFLQTAGISQLSYRKKSFIPHMVPETCPDINRFQIAHGTEHLLSLLPRWLSLMTVETPYNWEAEEFPSQYSSQRTKLGVTLLMTQSSFQHSLYFSSLLCNVNTLSLGILWSNISDTSFFSSVSCKPSDYRTKAGK